MAPVAVSLRGENRYDGSGRLIMAFRFGSRFPRRGIAARRAQYLVAVLLAFATCGTTAAQEFLARQELTAVASGEGAANGLFGWDVAIDGDIAVACDKLAKGQRRACCFDRSGMYSNSLSAPEPAR